MADFLIKETVTDELLETAGKLCKIKSLKEVCGVLAQEVKKYSEKIMRT